MPSEGSAKAATRGRPQLLRALGKQEPPREIRIGDDVYQCIEVFKHDSWAATALYQSDSSTPTIRLVCKFNRTQPIFGIPMAWLGNALAKREASAYQRLSDLAGIPAMADDIRVGQQKLRHAVAHEFVEGHPLQPDEAVEDDFFRELRSMLARIHSAGMAYVDLHKRENILVGNDGRPYLVDFQISFQPQLRALWRLYPWSWILRMMQVSDEFCLAKHVRNHRPDQLQSLGLTDFAQPPWWIRIHRLIAVPFRQTRRRLLALIGVRDRSGRAVSEQFAEHAFRCKLE